MMPLLFAATTLLTAPRVRTFDFADPKGTNTVTIAVDAPIEPVTGIAGGITGSASFDPAHPEKTTGEIRVAVESIQFGNPGYANSVKGYALEGKKFPTLTCKLKKIVSGKEVEKGRFKGVVAVDFTVKGITKALTIPLDVRYLPGLSKERDGRTEGDLMVVKTTFSIKRSAAASALAPPSAIALLCCKGPSQRLSGNQINARPPTRLAIASARAILSTSQTLRAIFSASIVSLSTP